MFIDWNTHYCIVLFIFPKLTYKANSILIIISAGFYKNLQGNSKLYMEMQWSKIAKNCYS